MTVLSSAMSNKFKDKQERWLTQSLFLELGYSDFSIYTLKEEDHEYEGKVYPSLKRLYVEFEDTTEYQFANEYLGGWQHWKRLLANRVIRKHIDEWREELEIKLRAVGIRAAVDMALDDTRPSFAAAKWVAEKGWEMKRGRPSKEEVEREKKFQAAVADEFSDDFERIRSIN